MTNMAGNFGKCVNTRGGVGQSLAQISLSDPSNDLMLVQSWIHELMAGDANLSKVAAKFRDEAIDLEALSELSEDELTKYGVVKHGWRKKLMRRARDERVGSSLTAGRMPECCVCMERLVNIALGPCGHLCVCESCAGPFKECPLCKEGIEYRLKVFFS